MSGLSISFDGSDPPETALAKADAAVAAGVETIWLACHLFQRDPVATAGVLLARHPRLKIVLMAVSPYVVHPVQIAMAAATLDEFNEGRVSLCLGVGVPAHLADAGVEPAGPLTTLSEALDLCRVLFGGETVSFRGERYRVSNRALGPGRRAVPLLLAASGPKMLRLAARHANGVVLSAGASVEFVRWSLDRVAEGGPPKRFRRCGLIYAAADTDPAAARDRVRGTLATVLRGAHHARNVALGESGLSRASLAAGDAPETLIDDGVVTKHAAAGTPETLRGRIAAYHAAGLDETILAGMRTPAQVTAVLSALSGGS